MLDSLNPRLEALVARSGAARSAALATLERSRQVLDRSAGARAASAVARATGVAGALPIEMVVPSDGSVSAGWPLGDLEHGLPVVGATTGEDRVAPPPDPLRMTLWASRACDRVDSLQLYGAGRRAPGQPVDAHAHLGPERPAGERAASSSPLLQIETGEGADGEHVLYLRGELDLSTAEQVRADVEDAVASTLVADLSGLTFMDAAGLTALLSARRAAEARGHELRLRGAQGIVRRVFAIVGMDDLLDDEPGTRRS